MVVVTSLRVIVANQVDFAFGFPYAIYVMTTEKKNHASTHQFAIQLRQKISSGMNENHEMNEIPTWILAGVSP